MFSDFVLEAYQAAKGIVQKNCTRIGVAASIEGYPQVWARDSMITMLGAAIEKDADVLGAFKVTLDTLVQYQDRFGQIPMLVGIGDNGTVFGSSDANTWFVIGTGYYFALTGDTAWAAEIAPAVVRALDWCESRGASHGNLIESGECADWADLLSNHGTVLFPNVLYVRALHAGAGLLEATHPADAARFRAHAEKVLTAVQDAFWVKAPGTFTDHSHAQRQQVIGSTLRRRPYFLPWVDFFAFGERFDVTANMMAILTDVATPEQAHTILDYVDQTGCNRPHPVRVLYPPIQQSDAEWRDYYKVFNLNYPNQYHNGGIWPWVGGAYVAALAKMGRRDEAMASLELLAQGVQQGKAPWEFNEWLHGESGRPMGALYQAWSAGMFLYAKHAIETGETPGLSMDETATGA